MEDFTIVKTMGYFLAAFNIYLRGDRQLSKSGMTEFFHNLLMQALSKLDDIISLKFDAVSELVKTKIFLTSN